MIIKACVLNLFFSSLLLQTVIRKNGKIYNLMLYVCCHDSQKNYDFPVAPRVLSQKAGFGQHRHHARACAPRGTNKHGLAPPAPPIQTRIRLSTLATAVPLRSQLFHHHSPPHQPLHSTFHPLDLMYTILHQENNSGVENEPRRDGDVNMRRPFIKMSILTWASAHGQKTSIIRLGYWPT